MENCKFKVFNWKYNQYLPCEIISKLSDRFWKVKQYIQNRDGSITTEETCVDIKDVKNI